jgi:hypothetical protein
LGSQVRGSTGNSEFAKRVGPENTYRRLPGVRDPARFNSDINEIILRLYRAYNGTIQSARKHDKRQFFHMTSLWVSD